ncbi:hypothetical protein BH23ACT11_BH23ACT11_14860 [soil metagenome]
MPERLYRDPLTLKEREEFEEDLTSFCDSQLDLLGEIQGLNVLYVGGSSLLWIEGLSTRIGANGTLTVLDVDEEALDDTRENLDEADLASPVKLVAGDVFAPPLDENTFDLAYSAGLFHELDVATAPVGRALDSLAGVVRRGGRIATTDFVDSVPAVQFEDEHRDAELARQLAGRELYGIGPPERLIALHDQFLSELEWQVIPPHSIRHFAKIALAEPEPDILQLATDGQRAEWRRRRAELESRIICDGYTRPATLFLEGRTVDR